MTQRKSISEFSYQRARRRTLTGAALAFLTLGLVVPFAAGATEATVEEAPQAAVEVTETTAPVVPEDVVREDTTPVIEPSTGGGGCLTGEAGRNALSASGPSVSGGVITSTVTNNSQSAVCQNVFMAVYIKTNDNDWPNSGLQTLVQSVRWNVADSSGLAAGASTTLTAPLPTTIDGRACPVQIDVVYEGKRGAAFLEYPYPYPTLDPETSKNNQSPDYLYGDLLAALHYPTPTGNAIPGCGELEIKQDVELSGCTPPTLAQITPIWFKISGTPATGARASFVRWVNMTPAAPGTSITKKFYVSAGTYTVAQVAGDGSNVNYSDALLTSTSVTENNGVVAALAKGRIVLSSTFSKCEQPTTTTTTTTPTTTTTTTPTTTTTTTPTTTTTTIVEQPTTTTTTIAQNTTTSTTVVDPTTTTSVAGQPTTTLPTSVKGQQLARTGQRSAGVFLLSTLLLLTGGALLGAGRRSGRRRTM